MMMGVVSPRQSRDCCTTEDELRTSSVGGTTSSSSSNNNNNNDKMMEKRSNNNNMKKKKKKLIKPWMILLFLTIIPTLISFRMMLLFEDSTTTTTTSTTGNNNNNINIQESSILQTSCGYYGNMYLSTKQKCQQRQREWITQLTIENHIYNQMIQKAIERSSKDVYDHQQHQHQHQHQRSNNQQPIWKLQLQKQYDTIKNLLLSLVDDTGTTNTTTNTNTTTTIDQQQFFSLENSFPDISIMDFPKAGTSHLYKLLISHPNTLPIFRRKEFCIDHGHFLDYTKWQNNAATLTDLKTKLYKYHKHVLHKRNITTSNSMVVSDAISSSNNGDDETSSKPTKLKQQPPQPLFVNACLQMDELMYHFAYMNISMTNNNNNNNNKFIILFRDPADWLWASWNYWIDKNLDVNKPIDHDWATFGIHYRSPELFHEFILSSGLTKTSGMRFTKQRESTVNNPRRLLFLVDNDDRDSRIMFIKSEDMKFNVDKFINDLSIFTGLKKDKFDMDIANSLTNCNRQKGYNVNCGSSSSSSSIGNNLTTTTTTTTSATTTTTTTTSQQQQSTTSSGSGGGSGYPITYHRPMLDVTRQLIYIQFWEECKIWSKEFGIVYQHCLDAVPSSSVPTTTAKV